MQNFRLVTLNMKRFFFFFEILLQVHSFKNTLSKSKNVTICSHRTFKGGDFSSGGTLNEKKNDTLSTVCVKNCPDNCDEN